MPPDPPSKRWPSATLIVADGYFAMVRRLLQMLLKALNRFHSLLLQFGRKIRMTTQSAVHML